MLDVVLAVWAAPGMNNPADPESPTGSPEAAHPDALAAAAERDERSADKRNHDAFRATTIATDGVDAGRAVWHPPRSHPSSTPRINHAHRADAVLDRMRTDARQRRTGASASEGTPTSTDTGADPP